MESNNDIIPGFDNDRDDSLTINLRRADGVKDGLFIYLSGYIDTYNSSFFQKKITNVIEEYAGAPCDQRSYYDKIYLNWENI